MYWIQYIFCAWLIFPLCQMACKPVLPGAKACGAIALLLLGIGLFNWILVHRDHSCILVDVDDKSTIAALVRPRRKQASAEMRREKVVEAFFLVFFGVTSFISMSGDEMLLEGAVTLGLTLFVLVHILGPVSGCHLNPVITIPAFMSGKMKMEDTIAYIAVQVIGATIGFLLFKELKFLEYFLEQNCKGGDVLKDRDAAADLKEGFGLALHLTNE